MPLQDVNSNDDRLRSLAQPLRGFGRLTADELTLDYTGNAAPEVFQTMNYSEPVRYAVTETEPVSLSDQGGGMPAPATNNAVPVVQTMTASTGGGAPLDLPKFDFSTGVASCNTCASDAGTSTASSAVASTVATGAKVTPLPEAPATTNYLLWGVGLAIAYLALRSPSPSLGCPDTPAPAPAPAPVLSGAPPRRKPAAPHKKVAHLTIS